MQLKTLKTHLMAFLKDEEGASGIEYALISAVIAVGLIAFLTPVREGIGRVFNTIAGQFPT